MSTLSRSLPVAMIGILLATQPGCVTSALLTLGKEEPVPAIEQPVAYTRAVRKGHVLSLLYDETVDADGAVHPSEAPSRISVNLGAVSWRRIGAAPMDPNCKPEMWRKLLSDAPKQPGPPLLLLPAGNRDRVISLHQQQAVGDPPITVQLEGLRAWIVCGAGDGIGYTEVAEPPPPQRGQSGERSAGAVVAIVLLFPFALALDIAGGFIWFLAKAR